MTEKPDEVDLAVGHPPSPEGISGDTCMMPTLATIQNSIIFALSISAAAAQQFTLFPRLPFELREMIWDSLVESLGPRIVRVKILTPPKMGQKMNLETGAKFPLKFLANKRSRGVFLRVAESFDGSLPCMSLEKSVRYRIDVDTVYIQGLDTIARFNPIQALLLHLPNDWYQQIQRILVGYNVFNFRHSEVRYFLHSCSKLKSLDILTCSGPVSSDSFTNRNLVLLGTLHKGMVMTADPKFDLIEETLVHMHGRRMSPTTYRMMVDNLLQTHQITGWSGFRVS